MVGNIVRKILNSKGYDIQRWADPEISVTPCEPKFTRIHYGCGNVFLPGWLNVDVVPNGPENYMQVNLTNQHPFPDNWFDFGFAEDFLEHIDQADSLLFLAECHRTLKPGGVLRLSFPGFEGVLKEGFRNTDFKSVLAGKQSEYIQHWHRHFYCEDSLRLVSEHFGFDIEFFDFRESRYRELDNVETRDTDVNIRAELTKKAAYSD